MIVSAAASSTLMTSLRSGCPVRRDHAAESDFNNAWRVSSVRPARTMALINVPFSRTAPPRYMRAVRQVLENNVDEGLRRAGEFSMDASEFRGDSSLEVGVESHGGGALIDRHGTLR